MNISEFNIGDTVETQEDTVGFRVVSTIGNLEWTGRHWMYCLNFDGKWYEEFDLKLVRKI